MIKFRQVLDLAKAYRIGIRQGKRGICRESNPFEEPTIGSVGHSEHAEWDRGYQAGIRLRGKKIE